MENSKQRPRATVEDEKSGKRCGATKKTFSNVPATVDLKKFLLGNFPARSNTSDHGDNYTATLETRLIKDFLLFDPKLTGPTGAWLASLLALRVEPNDLLVLDGDRLQDPGDVDAGLGILLFAVVQVVAGQEGQDWKVAVLLGRVVRNDEVCELHDFHKDRRVVVWKLKAKRKK